MTDLTEQRVYHYLASCAEIAALGGTVVTQRPYGVLLCLGTRPLGLWSVREDAYVFRELASYEPNRLAADLAEVEEQSIELLNQCRHGWAERFVGAAPAQRVA